jgi:hypothetical protein
MCPSSNVHTGAAASIRDHPIDLLRRLRFRVTVNTDNRLMSGVSLSSEFAALDEAFAIGLGEMEWLTLNALKSAFAPFDERLRLINEVSRAAPARQQTRVVGIRPDWGAARPAVNPAGGHHETEPPSRSLGMRPPIAVMSRRAAKRRPEPRERPRPRCARTARRRSPTPRHTRPSSVT